MFDAVQGVVGHFEAFIAASRGGFLGPLGLFQFVGQDLEPGGEKNLVVLEVLPCGLGTDLASPVIGEEVEAVVGAFDFELGVTVHPGHGAALPADGHGLDLLDPAEDGAIGVEFRGIGDIAVVRDFIQHVGGSLGGDGHGDGRTIGARIRTDAHAPIWRERESWRRCAACSMPQVWMGLGGKLAFAALIVIHAADEVPEFPEIGDGEFFSGQEVAVAVHGRLIEAVGIDGGRNRAFTDPVGKVGVVVAVFVKDAHPGSIGGGGEDGVAFADPEILGHGGEALDPRQLIGFAVDIRIDFLAFEGFGAFPTSGLEAGPVFEFQPEPAVFGAILEGLGFLVQAAFRADGVKEVLELRGAHIVFIPDKKNPGVGDGGEGGGPDPGPGRFPRFIGSEFGHHLGAALWAGGLGAPDDGIVRGADLDAGGVARIARLVGQVVAIGRRPLRGLMGKGDEVDFSAQKAAKLAHQAVTKRHGGGGDGHLR